MTTAFQQEIDRIVDYVAENDSKREFRRSWGPQRRSEFGRHLRSRVRFYARAFTAARAVVEGDTTTTREMDDFMTRIDAMTDGELTGGEVEVQFQSDLEIWQQERFQDLRENFLYLDFLFNQQRGYRSYRVHADQVAIKAAIHLLTEIPSGVEALASIWQDKRVPMPDREAALDFKWSKAWGEKNPAWWVEQAIRAVPGIYAAAHLLLETYSGFVRAEREKARSTGLDFEDTALPDEVRAVAEVDGVVVPRDLPYDNLLDVRMEAAIIAYELEEGNYKELAKLYSVPEKRLWKELHNRGLMRPRGGDVRSYRTPEHREEAA